MQIFLLQSVRHSSFEEVTGLKKFHTKFFYIYCIHARIFIFPTSYSLTGKLLTIPIEEKVRIAKNEYKYPLNGY